MRLLRVAVAAALAVPTFAVMVAVSEPVPAGATNLDCFGATPAGGTTWKQHLVDGGLECPNGALAGTNGADGVDAADFDGDCDLDLVTGWEESDNVFLYLNPLNPDASANGTCDVDPVDGIDNDIDGQIDEDGVLRTTRRAILDQAWPAVDVTGTGKTKAVEDAVFADLNGDGRVDAIVSSTEGGDEHVYIHRFNGNRANAAEVLNSALWTTVRLKESPTDETPNRNFMRSQVGDLDGDGVAEIVSGAKGGVADISLWRGNEGYSTRHVIEDDITWVMSLSLIDMDGDGDLDVFYTDRSDVAWLENPGGAAIVNESAWVKRVIDIGECVGCKDDQGFRWADVEDLDGDGWDEIVVAAIYDNDRGVVGRWYDNTQCPARTSPTQKCSWKGVAPQVNEIVVAQIPGGPPGLPFAFDKREGGILENCDLPNIDNVNSCIFQRLAKAVEVGDVTGDGKAELILSARGGERDPEPDFSYTGYGSGMHTLSPPGGVIPRCAPTKCTAASQQWRSQPIGPSYRDMKYDNMALVDFDMDGDADVASVEENAAGDKGLGVMWYENTVNHAPVVTGSTGPLTAAEGAPATRSGVVFDVDDEAMTVTANVGQVTVIAAAQTWTWSWVPPDGPASASVTITASDGRGGSQALSFPLDVLNVAPTVTAVTGPTSVAEGSAAAVTVTATDPAGAADPLTYELDCGADGTWDVGPQAAATGACTFPNQGNHPVAVRVGDGDGGTGTGTTTIAVTNVAPQVPAPTVVAVPSGGLTEMQDLRASLTFADPGVDDPHGCTVDHGDGFVAAGTVEGVVGQPTQHHCTGPVHAYADNGTYRVTITVSDDVTSAAGHVDLSIANVAPTVDVPVPSADPIDVGQPFSVSAGFTDPAGTVDEPYTCNVDLGAGTGPGTVNGTTCTRSSPGFATEGDRTIVARVTDKDGGTGQSSTTVTVANLAPAVGDVIVTPHPSLEGGAVTAAATFSDGGENGPYTCTVDHGDGSGPRPGTVVSDTCTGPSYVYDDDGAYTVTIAVTDSLGETGSANNGHNVDNVAPTATFSVVPEEIFVTEQAQLRLDDPFDPSGADTTAGFQYDFDCDGDSIWDVVDAGPSTTCTYLVSGTFTPRGRIADKDAGTTVYAAPLRILSLQEAVGVLAGQVDNVGPPSSLTRGQVRSLLAKLEQAVNRLDDDHLHTASQLIGAFVHEVDALERSGTLDPPDAGELRSTAERIVLAITRSLPPSPSAH